MSNSTHRAEVVPVVRRPHGNADSLEIVDVFGYAVVVRRDDWVGKDLAIYIPPDSIVDTRRPEFHFLIPDARADGTYRVKAKKLRGIVSFGMLVRAPADAVLGEDYALRLGITHYEPPLANERVDSDKYFMGAESASAPDVYSPKYDLEAFRRYHSLLTVGEMVTIVEKLDGSNSRFLCKDGEMHCGSRTGWKREFPRTPTRNELLIAGCPEDKVDEMVARAESRAKKPCLWWEVLRKTPALEKYCRDNEGHVVYGEVFGSVNCIKYGFPDGNRFAAFDVLVGTTWLGTQKSNSLLNSAGVPICPVVADAVPYDFEMVCAAAEGLTLVGGEKHGIIREGVVVTPSNEREHPKVGRVKLKCVSGAFLEKYR